MWQMLDLSIISLFCKNNINDLYTHPVFWTFDQHLGFLVKLYTLMGMPKSRVWMLDGLDDLTTFLQGEYQKERKR